MYDQIKHFIRELKLRTIVLGVGILLTFGLIAAAAPTLPNNAEDIVTQPRPRRGGRDGRRGNNQPRPSRDERPPQPFEDFFDF